LTFDRKIHYDFTASPHTDIPRPREIAPIITCPIIVFLLIQSREELTLLEVVI